jgi:Arc/MetJ-type ribon-helix-helix transcriptional regulator
MEKATLTISLPRIMKDFIVTKMREGRFSTPSEYIRSLIRNDQDLNGSGDLAGRSRSPRSADAASRATRGADKTAADGRALNTSGSKARRPSVRER